MALEETTEQVISTASNVDLSIMSLIVSSDFIGKSVIALLVIASIWSWAIILNKLLHYSALKKKMKSFEKKECSQTFSHLHLRCPKQCSQSNLNNGEKILMCLHFFFLEKKEKEFFF